MNQLATYLCFYFECNNLDVMVKVAAKIKIKTNYFNSNSNYANTWYQALHTLYKYLQLRVSLKSILSRPRSRPLLIWVDPYKTLLIFAYQSLYLHYSTVVCEQTTNEQTLLKYLVYSHISMSRPLMSRPYSISQTLAIFLRANH